MEETNAKCNAMPKQKEEERWEDLEPLLRSCASAMRSGELMHQKSFGLFEAMSAVEIMDPKMDAGCGGSRGGGVRDDEDDDDDDDDEETDDGPRRRGARAGGNEDNRGHGSRERKLLARG